MTARDAIVIDASVTVASLFEDEQDDYAKRVAEHVIANNAVVPTLWRWEVQNSLLMGERRGRVSEEKATALRSLVEKLPIIVDEAVFVFGAEFALARRHNLTVYDAGYLELAIRRGLKLATNDSRLAAAADLHGLLF